jgi:NTP pyrophosphatase (non-canonical NTP hydrolase)
MTIEDLQQQARELVAAQGWHDTSPEMRALWLVSEVGELAREVLQYTTLDDDGARSAVRQRLGAEMYDVVWNVCDLANMLGIALTAAFIAKGAINQARKWPTPQGRT